MSKINKKILVTGSNGFIGQSLIKSLLEKNKPVRGTLRSNSSFFANNEIEYVHVKDINYKTDWNESLINIDSIIHCAGRSHNIKLKKFGVDHKIYRSVNVDGTKQLAKQASEARELKDWYF
jgi:nucleoside-diphosphate-sugar epimerase